MRMLAAVTLLPYPICSAKVYAAIPVGIQAAMVASFIAIGSATKTQRNELYTMTGKRINLSAIAENACKRIPLEIEWFFPARILEA